MRGKVVIFWEVTTSQRITPAYAGKSHIHLTALSKCRDHPRLCGEKKIIRSGGSTVSGSPPPMRGKVSGSPQQQRRRRITPAYAGKSKKFLLWAYLYEDHPRLCGEKGSLSCCAFDHVGSPPPMRGKAAPTLLNPNL